MTALLKAKRYFFGFTETSFHDARATFMESTTMSETISALWYLGGGRLLLMFYQRLIDSRRWGLMTLHRQTHNSMWE